MLERLKFSFNNLQPHTVKGCINRANRNLKELYHQLIHLEDNENEDDSEEEDDDETSTDSEGSLHDLD